MCKKSGFLLINKPQGKTSFDVIKTVRKIFQIKKVGHSGTLDPEAQGLMLVGVGRNALRILEFHNEDNKTYLAKICLGYFSETDDKEGPLTKVNKEIIPSLSEILKTLKTFKGKIKQIPPKYSALKIKGEKICNLTRAGIEIDMKKKERVIEILNLELIKYSYPEILIKIKCSKGTYIRSVARNIGEKLKTGAYLSFLERTNIEDLSLKQAVNLDNLNKNNVLDCNLGLKFPVLNLSLEQIKNLQNGKNISFLAKNNLYQLFNQNEFYGIGKIKDNVLYPKKLLFE
jgi:tRNA pseudouridine55 synthase